MEVTCPPRWLHSTLKLAGPSPQPKMRRLSSEAVKSNMPIYSEKFRPQGIISLYSIGTVRPFQVWPGQQSSGSLFESSSLYRFQRLMSFRGQFHTNVIIHIDCTIRQDNAHHACFADQVPLLIPIQD